MTPRSPPSDKKGLQRPETRDLLKCRVDPTLLINTVLPVNGVFKEIGVRDPATVLATMLPDETRVTCGNKDHVIDGARIKASMQRCNSARCVADEFSRSFCAGPHLEVDRGDFKEKFMDHAQTMVDIGLRKGKVKHGDEAMSRVDRGYEEVVPHKLCIPLRE